MFTSWIRTLLRRDIVVFTDGGCKYRLGSWAFIVVRNGRILREDCGLVRKTSSNEMEIHAVIQALISFSKSSNITVFTDSRILIGIMNGKQRGAWPEATEQLKGLSAKHNLKWKWVRAHSGNPFNERCDELCIKARTIEPGP